MKLSDLPLDLIFYVLSGLGALVSFIWKGLGSVSEGELGVKCRWGRALKKKNDEWDVRSPGLVLLIPFVETLKTRHVREQSINLLNQNVTLADGIIQVVSATVLFVVCDVYKALFAVDNLYQSLENVSLSVVQETLKQKTYAERSADEEELSGGATTELQEAVSRWGVTILKFGLTDSSVLAEQAHLISMLVGAKMKVEALELLAEKLELESIADIQPGLAAAMIGTPLVSTVATNSSLSFDAGGGGGTDKEDGGGGNLAPIKALGGILAGLGKKTVS